MTKKEKMTPTVAELIAVETPEELMSRVETGLAVLFDNEENFKMAHRLATFNLTTKDIAGFFGVGHLSVLQNEELMVWINRGWTDYRLKVTSEVYNLAMIDLSTVEPEERPMYAVMKTKHLNEIYKQIHKQPFVPPQEFERVKRLSDDELQAEIDALAAALTPPVAPVTKFSIIKSLT